MQKNSSITLAIVMLVVGLGLGYAIAGSKAPAQQSAHMNMQGMHQMPDGSMMGNGGQAMSMSDMMVSMNAELEGKNGDAFDQAFISEMIVHHQGAVEMAELALKNAKHQEIKDLAKNIISAQTTEISQMQSWQKAWYNQ
ncbi:MAG TPA: DUF305 domain-containing protein [Candidatus Paceibacterota bacterium]